MHARKLFSAVFIVMGSVAISTIAVAEEPGGGESGKKYGNFTSGQCVAFVQPPPCVNALRCCCLVNNLPWCMCPADLSECDRHNPCPDPA